MNYEIAENTQKSIIPGEMVDTFYAGETNCELQAYPCVVNNKFTQNFTNLSAGTSQFVISPYQGVSDVVMYFQMPDLSGAAVNSMLPQSWGYSLVKQVSVRYGSSAQYFFSGEQLYLQTLWDCENGRKRDDMAIVGGNALANAAFQTPAGRQPEAYVYLNLPHNSPRADGKPLPLPSDLLVQPIIITVELNPIASVFVNNQAGASSALPTSLSKAVLQVKQELMSDSADLLARRVDMNTHGYTLPLKYFPQQEVQINLPSAAPSSVGSQNVNLTGFRAGEVRHILLWLTKASDQAKNGSHSYLPLGQVQLTYNGEIFYRADSGASAIWNLVNDTKSGAVNTFAQAGNPATWANSVLAPWTDIPFSQIDISVDNEHRFLHGKPILNAVVNLTFNTPTADTDYTLHAVYLYNCSLMFSRGGAEYVF